jgi:hypothetical protein
VLIFSEFGSLIKFGSREFIRFCFSIFYSIASSFSNKIVISYPNVFWFAAATLAAAVAAAAAAILIVALAADY